MKVTRRHALGTVTAAYSAFAVLRFPAGAAEFTYKIGANTATTHPATIRAVEAATKATDQSGGRLEVKVFANSVLGNDQAMLQQLRSGALEVQVIGSGILANVVPAAGMDGLPFLFADAKQAWAAADGPLGRYVHGEIEKENIHPLARDWDYGFKQIMTNQAVAGPDDLKGLKIRIAPSPVSIAFFKAMSASPVPVNLAELYTALQSKLVDGAELGLSGIADGKFYEVSKYVTLTNHNWIGATAIVNGDAWKKLPKNLQDIFAGAMDTGALLGRQDVVKADGALPAALQSRGMTVTKANFAVYQAAVEKTGLYSQWKEKFGAVSWSALERGVGKKLG